MKKNIIILYGGKSVEHDISIITGLQMIENIDKKLYNIIPIYITKNGEWQIVKEYKNINLYKDNKNYKFERVTLLPACPYLYKKTIFGYRRYKHIDCVFLCTHGTNCEDGTLQGYLSICDLAYTGCDVLSSAIGMDKVLMKDIFRANNIPCVKYKYYYKDTYKVEDIEKIGLQFPVIVKPSNLGSSIGITKCEDKENLLKAMQIAFCYDNKIIVEEVVEPLVEINCSVVGTKEDCETSKLEQPISWNKFLTFEDKYIKKIKNFRKNELNISIKIQKQIKKLSKLVFKTFCCSGVVRIDFLVNASTNEVFVNEINTIPGSMAFYLWTDKRNYSQHIDYLIKLAVSEKEKKDKLSYTFNSCALGRYNDKCHK